MGKKKKWIATGIVIGALNLVHYLATSRMDGVDTPFGLFPGGFPLAALLGLIGKELSPELAAILVLGLGILAGAALSARHSGELTLTKFRGKRLTRRRALQAAAGGLLMGGGIWMTQGCLIKHTLSGGPGLMLSSWVTLLGIVCGIWLAAKAAESKA